MPADSATKVLSALSEHGTVHRVQRVEDAPGSGYHVYAVFNGPEVLQIGHSTGGRMRSCMRGALAERHSKAFICAFGERVFNRPNDYAFIEVESREEAKRIEALVHGRFEIRTNRDAACLITGLTDAGPVSIARVNLWLWEQVVDSAAYRRLSAGRRAMAEELMDLVTWGTVLDGEPGSVRRTFQGDLLEGYMLEKLDKAHLIHVFQELTANYLRYGRHRLTDAEFWARERDYTYVPRREPFEVSVVGVRRTEAARELPVRRPTALQPAPVAAVATGAKVLARRSKLEFRKPELQGLGPDTWIEFAVVNKGTRSDPRRIDLVFRCQVRDVASFFPMESDKDWHENKRHSWSRFPQWAIRWVVRGGISAQPVTRSPS